MERKQYHMLVDWKYRSNRKPLVIRGARQVGKTYLVREFAEREFSNYIEINFDETPGKQELFLHENLDMVIELLSLETDTPVIPGKTLLFLDEIQRAPMVFARLRYFQEKRNDIHIIAAGSLLDFILADHSFSMPVGRIEYLHMGPMDFQEYLAASGGKPLIGYLEQYRMDSDFSESIHSKLLDHLRMYMSIGGMPASVREYTSKRSLRQCEQELSTILETCKDDFSRYSGRIDSDLLRMVFSKIPGMVGRKLKYAELSRDEPYPKLKKALRQLELARLVTLIHHSSGNGIPLRSEKKERDFKLLFLDSGLLMRSLGLNLTTLQGRNLLPVNNGALAEQFIGQQLLTSREGHETPELFYWNRQKRGASAEVDYLIQIDDLILPVEIKAGTTGSLKSLHVFSGEKKSPIALRFNLDTPRITQVESRIPGLSQWKFKLLSLPLYMISEAPRLIRQIRDLDGDVPGIP